MEIALYHTSTFMRLPCGGTPIQTVAPIPANNNYAVRLGSRWNTKGSHVTGSELLSKTFVVTAANANISFWYACVFMDPMPLPDPINNTRHLEIERPAFAVRVREQSGTFLNGLVDLGNGLGILVSNRNNTTMFQYDPATPSNLVDGKIIYRDWSCGKINLSSQIGKTVTIEFLNYDCRWGNHWGYTYLDNFCGSPCSSSCCPNLTNILPVTMHPGPISGYSFDNSTPATNSLSPGEYTIANSVTGNTICSNWNICPSNGDFFVFNGRTGQTGKTVIWQRNVNVVAGHQYKFCAKLKNLPQCCFDVKPKIDITFSASGNDILGEIINESPSDPCKWKELTKNIQVSSTGVMNIKILLDESTNGDGNDLAIDDIAFYDLPQLSPAFSTLTITNSKQINNKYNIIAAPMSPVPEPDCGYYWDVSEIDASNNIISGTQVSNPQQWWIGSSTPNTFKGYNGNSNLTGTLPGVFQVGKSYRISLGTYCSCQSWNQKNYKISVNAAGQLTVTQI